MGVWCFRNTFFFDDMLYNQSESVPPHLHMMSHVHRTRDFTPSNMKCFSNTETARTLTQHSVASCLEGVECSEEVVDTDMAQSHHYREQCYNEDTCHMKNDVIEDSRVLRYLDQIVNNTNRAIENIKLL